MKYNYTFSQTYFNDKFSNVGQYVCVCVCAVPCLDYNCVNIVIMININNINIIIIIFIVNN